MLKTEIDPTDGCTMYTLEKISDIAFLPEDEIPKALEALPAFVYSYRAVLLAAKDEGIEPEMLGLKPLMWKVDGASDVLLRSFDGELLAKISTRSAVSDREGKDCQTQAPTPATPEAIAAVQAIADAGREGLRKAGSTA
jgi:hypothetical protein